MKNYLLLIFFLSYLNSFSQLNYNLEFTYDNAGNQIIREFNIVVDDRPLSNNTYLKTVKAYPSPMQDDLTLEWKIEEDQIALVKIETFNLLGQLIHSVVPEKDSNTLPLNFIGHISGIYIVKFYYNDNTEKVIKVLKE